MVIRMFLKSLYKLAFNKSITCLRDIEDNVHVSLNKAIWGKANLLISVFYSEEDFLPSDAKQFCYAWLQCITLDVLNPLLSFPNINITCNLYKTFLEKEYDILNF